MKCRSVYTCHRHIVLYVPCGPRAYGVGAPVKGNNRIEHDDNGHPHLFVWCVCVCVLCPLLYMWLGREEGKRRVFMYE